MKKINNFLLLAVVLNEVCGSTNKKTRNIGGKKQCLEGPVQMPFLAKDGFAFATKADFRDKAKWEEAIQNKDIVPFPLVDGIEANNTDPTFYNGRFQDYETKAGVRGSNYRQNLAICTYEAVKSFENSEYNRVFRLTTENEMTCDIMDDGSVKGEKLTSFIVGNRMEATDAEPAYANIQLKYDSHFFSILKPNFEAKDLEGIFDVMLEQVSASATSITFKSIAACSGTAITSFEEADFVIKDDEGSVATASFVAADSDGVYEFTGTGFVSGYTIEIDGVVVQTEAMYEGVEPLEITVS